VGELLHHGSGGKKWEKKKGSDPFRSRKGKRNYLATDCGGEKKRTDISTFDKPENEKYKGGTLNSDPARKV